MTDQEIEYYRKLTEEMNRQWREEEAKRMEEMKKHHLPFETEEYWQTGIEHVVTPCPFQEQSDAKSTIYVYGLRCKLCRHFMGYDGDHGIYCKQVNKED